MTLSLYIRSGNRRPFDVTEVDLQTRSIWHPVDASPLDLRLTTYSYIDTITNFYLIFDLGHEDKTLLSIKGAVVDLPDNAMSHTSVRTLYNVSAGLVNKCIQIQRQLR